MGDENSIRTLGDYSRPSHEGYRNTIELLEANNVVPLRSDTIWLVQNRRSFHELRSEDPNQYLKDFLKLVDSLDLDVINRERMRLRLFQFFLRDQASNWLERLSAGSISTWEDLTTCFLAQFFPPERTAKLRNYILMFQQYQEKAWATIEELARYEDKGWNDPILPEEWSINHKSPNIKRLLGVMESSVDTLIEYAISIIGRSEDVFRISCDMMRQLPQESSRQEAFEDLVMNFILNQEEKVKQLEEYMGVIGSDFMQLSLEVMAKLKDEIRVKENGVKKIEKIMRYPDTKNLEPLNARDLSRSRSDLGILMEVEPLDESQLEDLGLNTCHDLFLSSREIPSFDELEPQPNLLPNLSPLDVNLGDKRGNDLPTKPHSPDSFRMKVVDKSTINTPPLPHVASFHPKDMYCYSHPCMDDPKKHYGFKPGLLGQSGSLRVDFSNLDMIEND
ncbi:zinc finger, CCHC-type containing protein [Tanacetum coccineum]